MKLPGLLMAVLWLIASACQNRDTQVSFTTALEDNQRSFDWDEVDTNPKLVETVQPIILGEQKDLYMGAGTWNQSACSKLIVANPSQSWNITVIVEDPDTELELEVAHCGIDRRDPWIVATDATSYASQPNYFPVDQSHDGAFKVSNFYFGKMTTPGPWPRPVTFTMVTDAEHFLVTSVRIRSTETVKLASSKW